MTTRDIRVGGIGYRMMASGMSAFVGLLRMDREPAGEVCGYATNLDADPRLRAFAGWCASDTDLNAILRHATAFHKDLMAGLYTNARG